MEILISLLASIFVFAIVVFLLKKPLLNYFNQLSQRMIEENLKFTEQRSREVFQQERGRLMEQYGSEKELMREKIKQSNQFLEHKKDLIKEMVEKVHQELLRHQNKISETEKERTGAFQALQTSLEEYKIITSGLKESADNLKNILSNNQLRGKYGEEVAENLLKSIGFVKGQNYVVNISQDTTSTRPDFTIYLPDGTKINIDAKFPLQSLIKYQETEDEQERKRHLRQFTIDVKEKIKQVTTRDYINPEDNTVDFVILFIPNEMIFSFIYDRLQDVWNEAMTKKVIMAGPFSFTAILRMVFQSYKSFKYQEDLYEIIKLIRIFEKEYDKFSLELDKLGNKIQGVENQYQAVSVTRTKKLANVVDRIKSEKALPSPE